MKFNISLKKSLLIHWYRSQSPTTKLVILPRVYWCNFQLIYWYLINIGTVYSWMIIFNYLNMYSGCKSNVVIFWFWSTTKIDRLNRKKVFDFEPNKNVEEYYIKQLKFSFYPSIFDTSSYFFICPYRCMCTWHNIHKYFLFWR